MLQYYYVDDDDTCGISKYDDAGREQENVNGRILGGWEAREHEFPWQVCSLWMNGHSCGAWLVSNDHAVSAAHCTDS